MTTVSSGHTSTISTGTISGWLVDNDGTLNISGGNAVASATTVYAGGQLHVDVAGNETIGTVLSGGYEGVGAGYAGDTDVLSNGVLHIDNTASAGFTVIVNAGSEVVYSGGKDTFALIYFGGAQTVYGSTLLDTVSGGAQYVESHRCRLGDAGLFRRLPICDFGRPGLRHESNFRWRRLRCG